MERKYKIITITGGDCAGKETQTKLLQKVLEPSVRMSAPDYGHWAGKIISCILHQKPFGIADEIHEPFLELPHSQDKHPQILQLLHNINTWDKQETIKEMLKTSHIIMDRYIEDAYAYGSIDGCSLDFLLELNRNFIQSDKVILLLGQSHPRSGEEQDINEKDNTFQQQVKDTFRCLLPFFPNWEVIETDEYQDPIPTISIFGIHTRICQIVRQFVGEHVEPLPYIKVKGYVEKWESQRMGALKTPTATAS